MRKTSSWKLGATSILLAAMMIAAPLQAQDDFKPVADLARFRNNFAAASSKVQTITSDFQQEKELVALTEKIVSTGKFWFKRDDKVRIDYQHPFAYRMVMNGDRMLIRDEQKENRLNMRSNRLFQQVNRIVLDCVRGSIMESDDFRASVSESTQSYRIDLVPIGKGVRDFFESIRLTIDKTTYSVIAIQMNEPGGDRTIMTFSNKTLNRPVGDEIFDL